MPTNASVTNSFTAGTTAVASQVNQNFSDLLTFLNTTGVGVYQATSITSAAMGALSVGTTALIDSSVTTAKLADDAVTNAKLATVPHLRLFSASGSTSVATATDVALTLGGTEVEDSHSMHSAGTLTIPTGHAGAYVISGDVNFGSAVAGQYLIKLKVNGVIDASGMDTVEVTSAGGVGGSTMVAFTFQKRLAAGDTIQLVARHGVGSTILVAPRRILITKAGK